MAGSNKFQQILIDGVKDMTTPKIRSSEPVNKLVKGAIRNTTGVPEMMYRMSSGQSLSKSFNRTFKKNGQLQYGKIAGSYMGAMAAGRVITGGGLTRDKNGSSDIIGVPFL